MLFFDLEFFVPANQRKSKTSTLRANPNKEGQFLLGGVITDINPFQKHQEPNLSEYWIWNDPSFRKADNIRKAEQNILKSFYSFFKSSWAFINKGGRRRDLFVVGTGISRFDLPILYIRSNYYDFASPSELFSLYFASKPIDLTDIGINYVKPGKILKPVSTSDLMRSLGLEKEKTTGQHVWELYDNSDYELIEQRTREEVQVNIELFFILNDKIRSQFDNIDK